ncbi:hypothetical protein J3Q64DRAFT_1825811 [Phycomyces blakesleeanus]|uniref:Uncharacterized protein n=2 Tax=Phycomyces blakesleeanus TaxID=4837 RepID=A0A167MR92_PHYB8|nr:hypothetical protein PHYBLDRAFT_64624 [Phycomyces blakesleeanus NRRL 1555(-)]OAD73649.1 hypothetical protein PHYBLDRAFT_64624 [Phycomyces blakesleeanus NRRL 1555(-)]|eukprot:XP_018291689.1 hypothetical protein PHYBLDRAFT_64624 [Phycomyces blakesleeanus NRRL 1555(-)]
MSDPNSSSGSPYSLVTSPCIQRATSSSQSDSQLSEFIARKRRKALSKMEHICRRMRSLANFLEGIDFEAYDKQQELRKRTGCRQPRGEYAESNLRSFIMTVAERWRALSAEEKQCRVTAVEAERARYI